MATEAQIAANRRNALKSTGPKTQEGKKTVSQNATSHGLRAATVLLPGEDPAEYDQFALALHEEYQPATPAQSLLVKRITQIQWRLDRIAMVECSLYLRADMMIRHHTDGRITNTPIEDDGTASWQQELDAINPQASVLGAGFSRSMVAFDTLQRYEAHLHRHLEKAQRDLERLQYAQAIDSLPYAVTRMKQISFERAARPEPAARCTYTPLPEPTESHRYSTLPTREMNHHYPDNSDVVGQHDILLPPESAYAPPEAPSYSPSRPPDRNERASWEADTAPPLPHAGTSMTPLPEPPEGERPELQPLESAADGTSSLPSFSSSSSRPSPLPSAGAGRKSASTSRRRPASPKRDNNKPRSRHNNNNNNNGRIAGRGKRRPAAISSE